MGIHRGPNTVKDGLVFGYDTGYGVADNSTATRFYPGKAVDNEFYNSGPDGTILDYVGYGGTGTAQSGALDALGTTDNIVYRKTGKLRFGPTGGDDIGTLYNGNTYTFSIYMRHVPGETQMSGGEFDIVDQSSGGKNYSGTLSSNMTYEWKRFSVTSTHTNSSNYHFIDVGTYQGTGVFEWCCPQIELGTIASPFTSTERSDTASLIDLKRTTNIDVSNVSFDSTGQPTFDGSNDYIDIASTNIISGTQDFTVESVYNLQGQTGGEVFGNYGSGYSTYHLWFSGQYGIWLNGSVYAPGAPLSNGKYHMLGLRQSGVMKLYLNGELVNSQTRNASIATDLNYRIGADVNGAGEPFTGEIYVVKAYGRALTAAEIKQNYNAYKNRFDI